MNAKYAALIEGFLVALLLALFAVGRIGFPIFSLFLIAWLSLHVRKLGWRDVGLRRPSAPMWTLLISITTAIAYQAADIYVLVPAVQRLTGAPPNLAGFIDIRGDPRGLVTALFVSWSIGGFVVELFFRGYLLNRLAELTSQREIGALIGLVASALVFAGAHAYQGPTGVVNNAIFGILLGSLYFFGRRNLWLPIITHGLVDTVGFLFIFSGLYP